MTTETHRVKWGRTKWECECGEQFATRQEGEQHVLGIAAHEVEAHLRDVREGYGDHHD